MIAMPTAIMYVIAYMMPMNCNYVLTLELYLDHYASVGGAPEVVVLCVSIRLSFLVVPTRRLKSKC